MKRKNFNTEQFQEKVSIKKLKKLYRYYLECMKNGSIPQHDKVRQTNLIKCLFWRLGIPSSTLEQKDFGKNFIAGKYDEQLDLSILTYQNNMACQKMELDKLFPNASSQKNYDGKKNEFQDQFYMSLQVDPKNEQLETLKMSYDRYCNGVIPFEEYFASFQNYFDSRIDVYGISVSDMLIISEKELSRNR